MSNVDTNLVMQNVTELLVNTVNISSVFYDVFLNPTPMDVTLTLFNDENEKTVITIPNRAKDKQTFRALTGSLSPEGNIKADVGSLYINSSNNSAYIKTQGSGSSGWVIISSEDSVKAYIRKYLNDNEFVNTSSLRIFLQNNNYITKALLDQRLQTFYPVVPMNRLISSGTVALVDNSANYIIPDGAVNFILPTVTNLSILHKILIQIKVETPQVITLGTSYFFDNSEPDLSLPGMYNLIYEYDNASNVWVCGWMPKGGI